MIGVKPTHVEIRNRASRVNVPSNHLEELVGPDAVAQAGNKESRERNNNRARNEYVRPNKWSASFHL